MASDVAQSAVRRVSVLSCCRPTRAQHVLFTEKVFVTAITSSLPSCLLVGLIVLLLLFVCVEFTRKQAGRRKSKVGSLRGGVRCGMPAKNVLLLWALVYGDLLKITIEHIGYSYIDIAGKFYYRKVTNDGLFTLCDTSQSFHHFEMLSSVMIESGIVNDIFNLLPSNHNHSI